MISNILLLEQKKIKVIIPRLEPYWQREVRELPDDLKKELFNIKAIPPLTTGGLERIKSVLDSLTLADLNIEEMNEKERIATETPIPETPPVVKKSPPTPLAPQTISLSTKTTNLPVKTNTNLPAPSTKPTQIIQKPQPMPNVPANKIDFGKYHQ